MKKEEKLKLYQFHADICKSLTHPTRLEIVDCLRECRKSVTELANELNIPQGTVSRHLGKMRNTGVVLALREGQSVYYQIGSPKILAAYDLMHQFTIEYLTSRSEMITSVR